MSESPVALGEWTRDELEAHIRDLEDEIESLDESTSAMRNELAFIKRTLVVLTDAEIGGEHHPLEGLPDAGEQTRGDIDDLQSAVTNHGKQLEAIRDVGSEKTGKDEKVAAIAAFAQQKVDGSQSKVLVEASEIRGCTGVSRRYAYDLVDTIGNSDQYEWAGVRDAMSVTTGSGTTQKKKALKVDCGKLRGSSQDPDTVNKFTTRTDEEGR